MLKKIPLKYYIQGGIVATVVLLVVSAIVGPPLLSYITVGFGGEGYKRYSTQGFDTGLEFAPNMFHAESYESFTQWKPSLFKDGKNMQNAPKGTIPRSGWYVAESYHPYNLSNTPEAYTDSTAGIKSPMMTMLASLEGEAKASGEKNLDAQGLKIYGIYCAVCHGKDGDGEGVLVQHGKYPTPGNYSAKTALTEGQMFHSVTYGKNLMGSYASQVTPQERWAVIYYIRKNFMKNLDAASPGLPAKRENVPNSPAASNAEANAAPATTPKTAPKTAPKATVKPNVKDLTKKGTSTAPKTAPKAGGK